MVMQIREDTARSILSVMPKKKEERRDVYKPVSTSSDGTVKKQPIRKDKNAKVGRNDPCPCGSGKKYKKCCGQ